jgi:putative ABC transport system substrate-binding protein
MSDMRRREFMTLLGGAAATSPFAARAQQPTTIPAIGLINAGVPESAANLMTAFRQGLDEAGYIEGQSVVIEYRWAEGRYDLIPELVADLLRRRVSRRRGDRVRLSMSAYGTKRTLWGVRLTEIRNVV